MANFLAAAGVAAVALTLRLLARRPSRPREVKLTYFSCKGRGEALRMLLADNHPTFTDELVDKADWPALKQATPCGGLPVANIDGVVIAQNVAIAHHLGRLFDLMGRTHAEHALCATVTSMLVSDLLEQFSGTLWAPVRQEEAWAASPASFVRKHAALMAERLRHLEQLYLKTPFPFLLGHSPCVADYYALYLTCILRDAYGWELEQPLESLYRAMMERPAIARRASSNSPPRARYSNSPAEGQVLAVLRHEAAQR